MYVTIQRCIQSQKVWVKLDDGIEIAQTQYQSPTWDKARRLIMVDKRYRNALKAAEILRLFGDEAV